MIKSIHSSLDSSESNIQTEIVTQTTFRQYRFCFLVHYRKRITVDILKV